MYKTKKDLLIKLSSTPKGLERERLLSIRENRNLLQSSGANITLYSGDVIPHNSIIQELNNIYIGVIQRLNAKTGLPDGIGALGGLSERTNEEEFAQLSEQQRRSLIGKKDDVIMQNGMAVLTENIDIIRTNNVLRETKEELGNLGIYDFKINPYDIRLIEMPEIKDDNFAINIWDGKGDVWCITPYCHVMKTSEETLDTLSKRSKDKHSHEENSEAAMFKKLKLTQALKCFGNKSGNNKLEDGRNANSDYRYPHEWLTTWALASELLHHSEQKIIKLHKELQLQTPWKISFKTAAQKMGKDLTFIADVLKISPQAIQTMENSNTGFMLTKNAERNL